MIFFLFFNVRLLSALRGDSYFSSPPQRPMTSDLEGFYPLHLFSYLNSWERASIFPFECSVLNKGTTGTIFITSLVWHGPWLVIEPGKPALEASTLPLGYRGGGPDWGLNLGSPALEASTIPLGYRGVGPWLGIEPGTSCTRSQHSTTRLSRRQVHALIHPTCKYFQIIWSDTQANKSKHLWMLGMYSFSMKWWHDLNHSSK